MSRLWIISTLTHRTIAPDSRDGWNARTSCGCPTERPILSCYDENQQMVNGPIHPPASNCIIGLDLQIEPAKWQKFYGARAMCAPPG